MKLKCPECQNIFDVEVLVEWGSSSNLTVIPKICTYCGWKIDEEKLWIKIYRKIMDAGRDAYIRYIYGKE